MNVMYMYERRMVCLLAPRLYDPALSSGLNVVAHKLHVRTCRSEKKTDAKMAQLHLGRACELSSLETSRKETTQVLRTQSV
jgi:hypothetical protein